MQFIAYLFVAVAVAGWLVAAGSSLQLMLHHRKEHRSFAWYAVRGYAFLDPDNFDEHARGPHSRMMLGMGLFLFGAMLGGLFSFLANPP